MLRVTAPSPCCAPRARSSSPTASSAARRRAGWGTETMAISASSWRRCALVLSLPALTACGPVRETELQRAVKSNDAAAVERLLAAGALSRETPGPSSRRPGSSRSPRSAPRRPSRSRSSACSSPPSPSAPPFSIRPTRQLSKNPLLRPVDRRACGSSSQRRSASGADRRRTRPARAREWPMPWSTPSPKTTSRWRVCLSMPAPMSTDGRKRAAASSAKSASSQPPAARRRAALVDYLQAKGAR